MSFRRLVRSAGMRWLGAAVVALSLLLAACSSPSGPDETDRAGTVATGRDFAIQMYQTDDVLAEEELSFAEVLQRGKPVVLNLWAGLCPPCRAEMPSFDRVYADHKDDFIMLGVDVGPFVGLGSSQDGLRLLEDVQIVYPVGLTLSGQTVRDLNVLNMPYTIYYNADGSEFRRHAGFITEGQLRDQVAELLDANRP